MTYIIQDMIYITEVLLPAVVSEYSHEIFTIWNKLRD